MSDAVSFDSEKLHKAINGLGQSMAIALSPFAAVIQSVAMEFTQLGAELAMALNNIKLIDWEAIEREMTLNHPERYAEESLADWYDRLGRASLIDKYEYRLMYGKECWRAVLHWPVWVTKMAWAKARGLWTKTN